MFYNFPVYNFVTYIQYALLLFANTFSDVKIDHAPVADS